MKKKSQRRIRVMAGTLSLFLLFPVLVQAAAFKYVSDKGNTVCYEGFVPCGKIVYIYAGGSVDPFKDGKCDSTKPHDERMVYCTFCHFFIMVNNIVFYVLKTIVPVLAVLMITVGGLMFYFGGQKPDLLHKGKTLIRGVVIGLFLVYSSYMLVGLFLGILGVSQANPLHEWMNGVFSVQCPVPE